MDGQLEEFTAAVRAIDPARVRRVVESDSRVRGSIDAPVFDFGAPAIVWAAGTKNVELLRTLVELGADVDARSSWKNGPYSALHHAAGGAGPVDAELAEALLEMGATLDLHSAAGLGRLDVVQEILEAEPDRLAEPGPDGATPLHMAGTPEVADWLLDRGAPIDQPCIDHRSTPAMWAVDGRRDVTRRLVERGARPDLWMAAAIDDRELARRLLEADPAALKVEPGDEALGGGDIYIWRLHFATSPLEVARRDGYQEMYALLHEHAPPELRMLEAALTDDLPALEALIAAHGVADLPEHRVRQLLCKGHDVVTRLLDAGADPDAANRHGQTALHEAAWNDDVDLLELLLDRGADGTRRDRMHRGSPFGWAQYSGSKRAADALVARGALDLHDRIELGRTEEVRAWIAEHPGQVDGTPDRALSPLRTAAWNGHAEIVRLLLDAGADPTIANPETGGTALDLARMCGHGEIIAMLESGGRHGAGGGEAGKEGTAGEEG